METKEKQSRMTRQKRLIMDEMKKAHDHPDADTVYLRVKSKLPKVSLATIYCNLEEMAKKGKLLKLTGSTRKARFDGRTDTHYHFHCVQCGRIEDTSIPPLGELDEYVAREVDSEICWHCLDFLGLCSSCRRAKSSAEVEEDQQ